MNIVYVFSDSPGEWNCSEWRCAIPARAINTTNAHHAALISLLDFTRGATAAEAACEAADLIVVQRNLFGPTLAAIQHWKARSKTVIADFDDAYDLMTPGNSGYRFWAQGLVGPPDRPVRINPPPLTQFKWGLRLVHAASMPSKRLADDWASHADVHLMPNFLDLPRYDVPRPEAHTGINIGWGGSLSHPQSFTGSGVLPALRRLCRARPEVRVTIIGDRRIYALLPLPEEQKIFRPWVTHAEWPRELARYDIGVAPLHGAYDERRSWIKVLEYMVMRLPWVASDGPPYHELRPYGWLVKNDASAWERVLFDMVDHLDDYRAEAQREPYLFAISQGAEGNVEKILATYAAIHERAKAPLPARSVPVPLCAQALR